MSAKEIKNLCKSVQSVKSVFPSPLEGSFKIHHSATKNPRHRHQIHQVLRNESDRRCVHGRERTKNLHRQRRTNKKIESQSQPFASDVLTRHGGLSSG